MIDTLKLYITDFEITPESPIKVQPGTINLDGETELEAVLFKTNKGMVKGAKAFLNDSKFRFDINSKGAFLSTEVSRWFGENNFRPISQVQFSEFSESIKKGLEDNGVKTNLENSRLLRLDLFRNGEMQYFPSVYFPVLRSCRGRRVHKRDYGDTVLFHNTRRESCFYDKFLQMDTKGLDVSDIPRNSLRGEIRLKTADTVQRWTGGMKEFSDIKRGFGYLKETYRGQLGDMVFRYGTETPEQLDCFVDDLRTLNFFREKTGKQAFNKWIEAEGILDILERYGDIESVRRLLLQVFTKGAVSKQIKRIEDTVKSLKWLGIGKVRFIDLYNELVETFLKVA